MDREYRFVISAVIGTEKELTEAERKHLKREMVATLNVHMDITANVAAVAKKRTDGAMYFKEGRLE